MLKHYCIFQLALFSLLFSANLNAQSTTYWGTTFEGGAEEDEGVIYKTDQNGDNYELVHKFTTQTGYEYFYVKPFEASNGKIYGTTKSGGQADQGTIFEYDLVTDEFSTVLEFVDTINGANPYGGLIEAPDGLLYGTTNDGGAADEGLIYSFDLNTHDHTTRYEFSEATGAFSFGTLMLGDNEKFYGMTRYGGLNDDGVIFEFDPTTDIYTVKHNFDSLSTGAGPIGNLMQADNGRLYGMTYGGGSMNQGVLFDFNISTSAVTNLVDMVDTLHGRSNYGTPMQASNGKIYGTVNRGGNFGFGLMYEFDTSTLGYTVLEHFDNSIGFCRAQLIEATDGLLYGTSTYGGTHDNGVIFSFDMSTSTLTERFSFHQQTNGFLCNGTLLQASNGMMYCGNRLGGSIDKGVFFEFDPVTDELELKANFKLAEEGREPIGKLLYASNGMVYGVARKGGTYNSGTIFSIDPETGSLSKVFEFQDSISGKGPEAGLAESELGILYGTTNSGLTNGLGGLFSFNISTRAFINHIEFVDSISVYTKAPLLYGNNEKIYGASKYGGDFNSGSLFEYDPIPGDIKVISRFTGTKGSEPTGYLIQASDDNLYGLTTWGGDYDYGVIYKYDLIADTFIVVHSFNFLAGTGATPRGGLVEHDGKLYGTTKVGTLAGEGIIFEFDIASSTYSMLTEVSPTTIGNNPIGDMLSSSVTGTLFGISRTGGTTNEGSLFEFNIDSNSILKKWDFEGPTGSAPRSTPIEVHLCFETSGLLVVSSCDSYTSPMGDILT
ncbi:MAG: putative repeat protein (TIGR03803 family), partial [Limisphaerales bacterium]